MAPVAGASTGDNTVWPDFSTLPAFVAYFGLGVLFLAVFCTVHIWLTPQREMVLIRQGNQSAAISLAGALIGFVAPLASAMVHSVSLADLALWGAVAMVVQWLAHLALRPLIHDLAGQIEQDNRAVAVLAAAVAIGVGLINAAAMTW
jgi:putative membrane protein